MKLPKNCKIEKCVSTAKNREVLHHPYMRGEHIFATDGRMMMRLPIVREEHDVDGFVTCEALKAARALKAINIVTVQIGCTGQYTQANGATMPRDAKLEENRYPNCSQVMPDPERKSTVRFAFNVKLLLAIAEAMDSETVVLDVVDEVASIKVSAGMHHFNGDPVLNDEADARAQYAGVLMPVRIS